jgi:hypothetical protein
MVVLNILIPGLLIASGVYAWSYIHFHPEKRPPQMPKWVFNMLCLIMILGGLIAIVAPIVFPK